MFAHDHPISMLARMAFFAEKPQNLQSSRYLVLYSAIALLLTTAAMAVVQSFYENLYLAFLQIATFGLVVWIVLRLTGKANRWLQTATALFGTTCIIRSLSYLPVKLTWDYYEPSQSAFLWVSIVALPFGIWNLCVSAFILKEAMEISATKAFFVVLGIALLVSFIVLNLFGFNVTQLPDSQ
jgi:hypothetical protein